jgi:hypothetical protein
MDRTRVVHPSRLQESFLACAIATLVALTPSHTMTHPATGIAPPIGRQVATLPRRVTNLRIAWRHLRVVLELCCPSFLSCPSVYLSCAIACSVSTFDHIQGYWNIAHTRWIGVLFSICAFTGYKRETWNSTRAETCGWTFATMSRRWFRDVLVLKNTENLPFQQKSTGNIPTSRNRLRSSELLPFPPSDVIALHVNNVATNNYHIIRKLWVYYAWWATGATGGSHGRLSAPREIRHGTSAATGGSLGRLSAPRGIRHGPSSKTT